MGKYSWSDREAARKKQLKEVKSRPMRTGTPFKRTPLKKQSKPLAKKSKKLLVNEKIYKQLRKDFLKDQPECVVKLDSCTKKATDVHHAAGRGVYLNVVEYFVPVCRNCHTWIETHPIEAKEMGHSFSRITKPKK